MVVLRALRLTAVALPREPTERRPPRAHASPIANHRPFGADPVIRAGLPIAPESFNSASLSGTRSSGLTTALAIEQRRKSLHAGELGPVPKPLDAQPRTPHRISISRCAESGLNPSSRSRGTSDPPHAEHAEVRCGDQSVPPPSSAHSERGGRRLTRSLYGRGSNLRFQLVATFKPLVLGPLGWNSYGTERAQPVANVQAARSPKMA
jgi:hypothetical protein